jgi:hypothetical protein
MATHVRTLGILHIVLGALGVLIGLMFLLFFGGLAAMVGLTDSSSDAFVAVPVLGGIGALIFVFVLLFSIPGIIVGIGLVRFSPWARILGIIVSALELLNVPFGTALGIYGLWVLLSNETERLFSRSGPVQAIRAGTGPG